MEAREAETTNSQTQIDYTPSSEEEAWMGVIYACANADDYISNTEIDKFTRALSYKTQFEDADMVAMFEKINEVVPKIGNERMIEICSRKISREMRPTVFAIAMELVISDGVLHDEEEQIIQRLRSAMDLDLDLAQKIIDVLHIRFKGNVEVSNEEDDYEDLEEDA